MKTSVIEVHDMLSVLSIEELEKRIRDVPGVESATINFAAGSATVRYDETRLEIPDIKSAVRRRAHESTPGSTAADSHQGLPAPHALPPSPAPSKTSAAVTNEAGTHSTGTGVSSTPEAAPPKPSSAPVLSPSPPSNSPT